MQFLDEILKNKLVEAKKHNYGFLIQCKFIQTSLRNEIVQQFSTDVNLTELGNILTSIKIESIPNCYWNAFESVSNVNIVIWKMQLNRILLFVILTKNQLFDNQLVGL